ncbi:MAG: SDR family NAD(P)-dependent oxidoreductase [Catenulisporales bacterium]|nr:SDR family NAD(P)-dependent oxidoreductase [Catenulisporales bacterium]
MTEIADQTSPNPSGTDIAIVGMSGRFPGHADIAELWRGIRAGATGITRFTDAELRAAGVSEDLLADPDYVKAGGVLDGIDRFDADFFGVNPKEAQVLDPQHRLFLEHCWEALEDAGCDPTRFDGLIGVIGGSAWSTYLQNNLAASGVGRSFGEMAVGLANDKDSLTTRAAFLLGLTGPSYAVQSYCSTSLVAVCAAASTLAGFEADLVLAGGVNISVPHRVGYLYQEGGIAPPDGECRPFDAAGLGSALASGVGVVALRRLEDALAAGDRVYAVIRGWAVNNDGGRKVGFTAPGVQGQAAVISEALATAGLEPGDIGYVETHGTGTALGDAVELAALQQVFAGESVRIGSVKSNLGHTDRAAGVTNLIKAALVLHRGEIPPTRNFDRPNPQLATGDAELEVVTSLTPWPRNEEAVRRVGVSAFGIGGTNAHVVLEEAPLAAEREVRARPELLVWSARSAEAADAMTEQLAAHLGEGADALADVAYTLQTGRRVFEHRRIAVAAPGASAAEIAAALRDGGVLSRTDGRTDREVAFLIAGTGEQYQGLAEELYRSEPVFREVLDQCREILGTDPLVDMLRPREQGSGGDLSRLLGRAEGADAEETATLQPALFAVEYALARLLESWGVRPSMVMGYSLGEYVAACLAGVLSLPDALALVAHRAALIDAQPRGAMAAVPLAADDLRARIADAGIAGVDVAAINGPGLTVISGAPEAVAEAGTLLAADAIPCRPLATTHAFHSAMLAGIKAELTEWVAANITINAPQIPYLSNVTGAVVTAEQVADPGYWAEHMCAPVQFDAMLSTLLAETDAVLLELGPGASLGAMARGHRDCMPDRWPLIVPTLPAAADPRTATTVLTEAVGRLWLAGVPVDWSGYQDGRPVAKTGLPTYPFQRRRYWIDPPAGHAALPAASLAEAAPDAEHVQLMSPRWTAAELGGDAAPAERVVLLADRSGLAEALAEALDASGLPTEIVTDGLGTDLAGATTTVVDLRLLDAAPDQAAATDQDPATAAPGTLIPTLAAALDAWGTTSGTTRYLVATAGGQAVAAGERPIVAQAAVAALPVVANQEYLNLDCRAIDLDPRAGQAESVRALAAEVRLAGDDVLAAYRAGRRHVREYVTEYTPGTPAGIRSGGTYLVTGGLGDVGLLVAGHLAAAGAARLVLTSRGGLTADTGDRRADAVRRLRERGVEVLTPQVDITDAAAMRALFADLGRVDGVVHAAATTTPDTFHALRDVAAAAVAVHFGAKVDGALVLRELLAELAPEQAPEFCLLFSSTSSILGGITFGSYAAANAALTAVAELGDDGPTRWIAAAWDTWSVTLERMQSGFGSGMAAHAMTTEEGLAAFDRLLAGPRPALAVVAGGLGDRLPRAAALLDAPIGTGERYPRPDLAQPYTAPLTATERALCELWSDVLGIEPVGTRDAFFDLGGNSLLGLQMLALVKKRFGVAVPAVQLFEAPTVQTLAAVLDAEGGQVPQPKAAVARVAARPAAPARATGSDDDRRIAIVGMAGRFPGAASVEAFWDNIREGVESISFFSDAELLASGVPAEQFNDSAYVRARPVLDDVASFDAGFFGMNPRMAKLTDPQQRLFLEVCWEALEQSGYVVPELRGKVGVYGGANLSSYLMRMPDQLTSGDFSIYEIIMGNDKDALTTTVSYLLDLYGPSVAVQTFCSTSLVATHLAVQSLRSGESDMAIAGGVSIRVPDRIGHDYMPGGMESPDGHVRTFDAQARGSMFGDGAAAVVLKRLSDAVRDGDHIWSVIRGSAMNNDGALKVGFTAPSVVGQSRVIADAMVDAGVTGEDISYIEAHGTATELGDPIEMAALTRAFGETSAKQYCPIGSVKTNVGHLDRAAGVTGLIKTALSLTDQVIPPSLHYTAPNPRIDFENSPFYVNTALTPWRTRDGRPAIAGLNSLGMGGTNVHLVVEQPPVRITAESADPAAARRYQMIPLSARSTAAVDAAVARLGDHLDARPDTRFADVAYTLQVGRKQFDHRRALVADSVGDVVDKLRRGDVIGRVDAVTGRPVAFLFTGVGEQYPGLVRELYRREPVFRALLDESLEHLRALVPDIDLADLLTGERGGGADLAALLGRGGGSGNQRASVLERTEVVQPALFAVEYALARTLMTWGVQPRLMLGYSLGEYVAACLSGVLSLPDALRLVAHRAKLISGVEAGSMVAVGAPSADLAGYGLTERGLDIAAVNGPQVTVVAGPQDVMDAFTAELRDAEIPHRALDTTHAFHSRMLEPIQDALTAWVEANVTLNAPEIPYISNVTGTVVTADQVTEPAYWARHMCRTVQFGDAIAALLADPELAVVEIGPGGSLGALIRGAQCPPDRWPLILATLPAAADSRPDDASLTDCLARLWLAGVELDWTEYQGRNTEDTADPTLPGRIPLPTYPFQRQRYWNADTGAAVATVRTALPAAAPVAAAEPAEVKVEVLRPRWTPAPIATSTEPLGKVVLLAGEGGVAETLAELLRAEGTEVATVGGGMGLTREEHAAAVTAESGGDRTIVVDLRLLDHPADDLLGDTIVQPIARMLDAWGSDGKGSARILVATRGGHPVADGDLPRPAQHAAAVLQAVANLEYLNLDCATVDLGPGEDAATIARALVSELRRPEGTDDVLVGYRAGIRHVREYVPVEAAPAERAQPADDAAPTDPVHRIREAGTYLITGGLGDLGLILAEHFAAAGAGRLILTSRGGVPSGGTRADAVARLRAGGVEVLTPAVDVTDAAAMREVLAGVLADGGRLDGVVHAAAVTHPDTFRPLRTVDDVAVGLHFGAKVGGALVLDELLAELSPEQAPEFCLLFSSSSSILGGITFACYAAANAALAALGQRGHARFLAGQSPTRWISSAWDTWSVTLAAHGPASATMAKHTMTREQALAAFDRLLAGPGPSLVVAAGGLTERLPRALSSSELTVGGEKFPRPDLPQPYRAPATPTERTLCELWSHLLGVEPVGVQDAFFDLGGNSLLGLQMLALVKKRFGVAVPAVALFESPNVHGLAAILDGEGATDREAATGSATVAARAARPEQPATADAAADDRRIAVVGMAGRFPGASSVAGFWNNVRDGVESISFFTDEELLASGVTPEELADPDYVRARPVLEDTRGFDAQFFGMSPRMAKLTDPQQRLFLEVCWEALEQSGYVAPERRGRVGVYGGANISTYLMRHPEILADPEFSVYEVLMGNDKDALTTTVSYLLDLNGPSIAVQTFCSTSLVATHMAVQALRNGECELALAGGVSVHVPDRMGHRFESGGMASPDGHVRTFDAEARGSMFGDGVAVVALKRLSDALRDGDHIWSVIRGSAVNNDGAHKVGFTAPSVVGQSAVVAEALADAGLTGEDISYIEAHGTATELGDPIEVAALTRAFGDTSAKQYCPIGSVKTNVGHLDRAAGVTGLIKTSMALTDQVIPPSLHYTTPNPNIDFEDSPFYVNTELTPWRTRDGRPAIAGVNSLGMGGTNVHLVVERAPERAVAEPADPAALRRYHVVPLSARSSGAVEEGCVRLGEHLLATPDLRLRDVAYTLQAGRRTFEHRRAVVADTTALLAEALTGAAKSGVLGRLDTTTHRPVAFLFTGVGEQYPGLVRELYRREPVFREHLEQCLEQLRVLIPDADLTDLLTGARGGGADLAALLGRGGGSGDARSAALERTEVVQPALFAVEYALARTLMTWGVQPRLMLGYSLGEYVAACLAGVLSLPDALRLVAQRAKLIAEQPGGAMAAVSLTPEALERKYRIGARGIDIAALNGPEVTVVAGPRDALDALAAELLDAEVPCRPLQTTHAFHSRMLEPARDALTAWVKANVTLNAPKIPYISNVTGIRITADQATDPAYWARHMCGPVRFAAAIGTLLADPDVALVEIGPGQSLGALVRAAGCAPERWSTIVSTLPAAGDPRPDDAVLTDSLARLWLVGADVDWTTLHERQPGARPADPAAVPRRVPLPTYAFQRQEFWIESTLRPALPAGGGASQVTLDTVAELPKLPEERWLHLPVWRQTAPAPTAAAVGEDSGSWLVFTRDGIADRVVDRLRATGARLELVRPGAAYESGRDGYAIKPGDLDDIRQLLRDLRVAGKAPQRIVHLWTLGSDDVVADGLHTLAVLARACGELDLSGWQLDAVTSGVQHVLPGDVADPLAATLTGPALVIPIEYPTVSSRLIDLDAAPTDKTVAALVAELVRADAPERSIALRHGRRWVCEYEALADVPAGLTDSPADASAATPTAVPEPLRPHGVYLITGGLGGIGLAMAERLAAQCQAKLVLLGRTGLPPRADWPAIVAGKLDVPARVRDRVTKLSALLDLGAEVEIVVGDVSRVEDARRAVDTAVQSFGALHGVLHAAGLPGMGLMQFKQPAELDEVLAPKVAGTLALAEALRLGQEEEIRLDFLALFSSITSATGGGPGQADYCSANAFLDAFAARQAAEGRPVVAVDWGEWLWNGWSAGLDGYAETLRSFLEENRARIGIGFDEGWRCLLRALACGEPRVVVSTQDFGALVRLSAHFTLDAVAAVSAQDDGSRHPRPELMTPFQEPDGGTEETVARIWRDALRLERVGVQDNFFELGGNSLLGVTIVTSLRKEFGLSELPPHALYEAPTVAALAEMVDKAAAGAPVAAADDGGRVRAQLRRSGVRTAAARRKSV